MILIVPAVETVPALIGAVAALASPSNSKVVVPLVPSVSALGESWLPPETVTPSFAPSATVIAPVPTWAELITSSPPLTSVTPL